PAVAILVNVTEDEADAVPGDGVCATAAGGCSLRAAISEANLSAEVVTITIGAAIDPQLSIEGAGEDGNATGDLDVLASMTIDGSGATILAERLDRAIDHHGGSLVLTDLTLADGSVT